MAPGGPSSLTLLGYDQQPGLSDERPTGAHALESPVEGQLLATAHPQDLAPRPTYDEEPILLGFHIIGQIEVGRRVALLCGGPPLS